ncbi:MAG: hypothetical protein KF727_14115 [Microbacteriaceae bacterium]|nr:hypothetical protein [Microbacteriaceae bacterium]
MSARPSRSADDGKSVPSAERAAMYELAVESGARAVASQAQELEGMRNRAVAFFAFTAATVGFLLGTGLNQATDTTGAVIQSRDWVFYTLAGVGTGLSALALVALIAITIPGIRFRLRVDAEELWNYIEGDPPVASRAVLLRTLAQTTYPTMFEENAKALGHVRRLYRLLLISGTLALAAWVALVWQFA